MCITAFQKGPLTDFRSFWFSFRCRKKTGVPGEKPVEASLDWKPSAHKCQDGGLNQGLIGAKRWKTHCDNLLPHWLIGYVHASRSQSQAGPSTKCKVFFPVTGWYICTVQSAVHCTNVSEPDTDGNPSKQLFDCFNPQKYECGTFFTQSESLNLKSCANPVSSFRNRKWHAYGSWIHRAYT